MRISDWSSDVCSSDLARGIAQAEQVQGKELSYNNINDADAALELVAEFREADPTCVIVKHANPCGVATAATIAEAYDAAFKCDDVSAFGGIIALNRPLDGATRSEEHTSELQSLMRHSYAVFCLTKKNKH